VPSPANYRSIPSACARSLTGCYRTVLYPRDAPRILLLEAVPRVRVPKDGHRAST
jgi:hypothetical protein